MTRASSLESGRVERQIVGHLAGEALGRAARAALIDEDDVALAPRRLERAAQLQVEVDGALPGPAGDQEQRVGPRLGAERRERARRRARSSAPSGAAGSSGTASVPQRAYAAGSGSAARRQRSSLCQVGLRGCAGNAGTASTEATSTRRQALAHSGACSPHASGVLASGTLGDSWWQGGRRAA